ncbi:hypothetical protein SELMODRAFT_426844 [Selaginella moellendorffii]|uniref:Prolyl 4-hydroxylase alpha subunit Fe(2+) 2OG dioxygenase domain-containing protein n=1 Tax=Selaginella moellendorffii TaxID=88036 RepID=D8SXP3_SELML|nr:hypothetical protein SELMODRAFT_426844 [Selaginella moellendorffii]
MKEQKANKRFVDYQALLKVLWSTLPRQKYATGGEVDASKFAIPASLRVEGAGDLALPLSGDGFLKLKAVSQQAPYGKGEETLLDTDVRRAWQVDASKVSCPQIPDFFSKVVLDMAVPAMEEMGIDAAALGLDVRLYKLLLYEQGGHFKSHRDTEKEVGMFATMILQLPTESGHEGGKLEILHGKKSVTFDFSGPDSRTGYFQTAFFCDCEHKLAEVTSGTRLCLVFSLVRSNAKFVDVDARHYVSAIGSVQSQLKQWAEKMQGSSSPILAIPLGHKYSNNSLSFAGLKGHDRVVAALVLSCTSFLDVYLCMLVKHTIDNEICDIFEVDYSVENWTTIDDQKPEHFTSSSLSLENQVVRDDSNKEDPFDDSPDKKETEPYNGNDGGDTNSFYHTAALVVWPKDCRMEALCATQSVRCVVNWLEEQHKREPGRTSGDLERYVDALSNSQDTRLNVKILLEFCVKHDFRDAAFSVMKKWGMKLMETEAQAMVAAVQKYGWDECYSGVIEGLLQEEEKQPEIVSFAEHLSGSGLQEAAVVFAYKLLEDENVCTSNLFLTRLLGFFVKCGREDDAWKILDIASTLYYFPAGCLVQVVKKWGESSFLRIEESWEKTLAIKEASWEREAEKPEQSYGRSFKCPPSPSETAKKKMEKLAKLQLKGRRGFLQAIAEFVLELESQGCHDAARALAKKRFIKDVDLEEIYGGLSDIGSDDALVLLLALDEKFHDAVRKVKDWELRNTVIKLKQAAGLIGLKKDEKVTQLFLELLSRALIYRSHYKELAEVAIWLGNEEIVGSIVKRVRSGEFKLLEKNLGGVETWDDIASLNKRAKRWDDAARDGLKKVINAKIYYYEGHNDEVDEEDEEDEEDEHQKLNPRLDRVNYERMIQSSGDKIEKLRKLLNKLV